MMALGTEVAGLDRPVGAKLALDVEQVLLSVRSVVAVGSHVRVRRRKRGWRSTRAGRRHGVGPGRGQPRFHSRTGGPGGPVGGGGQSETHADIARHIEVHRVAVVLREELAERGADHGFRIRRPGDADARGQVVEPGLLEGLVELAVAAYGGCVAPDERNGWSCRIWIRAVALPDHVRPQTAGLRNLRRSYDRRDGDGEQVARMIREGRSQLIPHAQGQCEIWRDFPGIVYERVLDVALIQRVSGLEGDRGLVNVAQQELGESVAAGLGRALSRVGRESESAAQILIPVLVEILAVVFEPEFESVLALDPGEVVDDLRGVV